MIAAKNVQFLSHSKVQLKILNANFRDVEENFQKEGHKKFFNKTIFILSRHLYYSHTHYLSCYIKNIIASLHH